MATATAEYCAIRLAELAGTRQPGTTSDGLNAYRRFHTACVDNGVKAEPRTFHRLRFLAWLVSHGMVTEVC